MTRINRHKNDNYDKIFFDLGHVKAQIMVMIMRNEDDNDDKDLRMGTGVEVSRSASEN